MLIPSSTSVICEVTINITLESASIQNCSSAINIFSIKQSVRYYILLCSSAVREQKKEKGSSGTSLSIFDSTCLFCLLWSVTPCKNKVPIPHAQLWFCTIQSLAHIQVRGKPFTDKKQQSSLRLASFHTQKAFILNKCALRMKQQPKTGSIHPVTTGQYLLRADKRVQDSMQIHTYRDK